MILIVGIGNPGKKFTNTRHNVGSRVVGELELLNFRNVVLSKPTTFMNESGKAVKKLTHDLRLITNDLWVIHDDLDLPLGEVRIVKNRSSAGHKGVQSIIDELKTKNFARFRIGIKPTAQNLRPATIDKFVLQKFNKEEEKIVKKVIKKTCQAVELALKEGLEKAMSKYNG